MNFYEAFLQEVQLGVEGRSSGLDMGFERLNKFVAIRKGITTSVLGSTGLGKSSWAHTAYLLNPYDWSISKQNTQGIKFKAIVFAMERSKLYTLAKWCSRKIFKDHGILIPVGRMMGWGNLKMSHTEHDYVKAYEDYFGDLLESIEVVSGAQTPEAIYAHVTKYALKNGREEEGEYGQKKYIPDDSSVVTMLVCDHMSLIKKNKQDKTKKEAIDRADEYFQKFRDLYMFSPVLVLQQNRDFANPMMLKSGSAEPTLEHAKDSGASMDSADVVLSLFDPRRYKQKDPSGYELDNFVDPTTGGYYYRNIKILKNTYGESDLNIGMAFYGPTGDFRELPRVNKMEGFNYESLFNGSYFLT